MKTKQEHCNHTYCGICIEKGKSEAIKQVLEIIDEVKKEQMEHWHFINPDKPNSYFIDAFEMKLKQKLGELKWK